MGKHPLFALPIQLTIRLHSSGPVKAPDSPDNYQSFESITEYITRSVIFRIINYAPDVLHEGNEEDREARVR